VGRVSRKCCEAYIEQKTVTVLALDAQTATLRIGAKKTPVPVALTDILGCDYARGDHGEE